MIHQFHSWIWLWRKTKTLTWKDNIHPIFITAAAAAAKSLQLCLTLCDPRDGTPPGSTILGILQARILEWVAISFSNEWKWKVKVKSLSHVWLLATPWTAAHQAPLSRGFARQEYRSGVPLPSPYSVPGTLQMLSYLVLSQQPFKVCTIFIPNF